MNPRSADPSTIDGIDVADLIGHIVWAAGYHRSLMLCWRHKADSARDGDDAIIYDAYQREASREYSKFLTARYPLLQAIRARTREERVTAEMRAADGWAFLSTACSGETCLDCDRPLWQHVVGKGFGQQQLCPFGREYWFLARAIITRSTGTDSSASVAARALLSEIARRDTPNPKARKLLAELPF